MNEELVCKLMKYHLYNFFEKIDIPYIYFKKSGWDVSKVIYENINILFYSNWCNDEKCTEKEIIIKKYNDMILKIFRSEIFTKLLIKWTENINYMSNNNFFILNILKSDKYCIMTPNYIIETYKKCIDMDKKKANKMLKKCLEENLGIFYVELNLFKNKFMEHLNEYTCGNKKMDINIFLFKLFKIILFFCDKLIDLNIYSIYDIVNSVIGIYIPINIINRYDSREYNNRELIII